MEWYQFNLYYCNRNYGVQTYFDFAKYTRKSLTLAIVAGIEVTPGRREATLRPPACSQVMRAQPAALEGHRVPKAQLFVLRPLDALPGQPRRRPPRLQLDPPAF